MNFSPFGGHFPAIHQFAAKFSHEPVNGQTVTENSRYHSSSGSSSAGGGVDFSASQSLSSVPASSAQNSALNSLKYTPGVHNQYPMYNDITCPPDIPKVKREDDHGTSMPASWQSLAAPGSAVADYLSHLPASTLPLSLHHFLKYSAESIKKEVQQQQQQHNNNHSSTSHNPCISNQSSGLLVPGQGGLPGGLASHHHHGQQPVSALLAKKKKKKKPKEKKPRPKPGEIRLTTALDGSTLYCCPECHMAYPEKELLEQHLMGHTLERRFVCDICGAGLKRKDHLTRHKQSHNPERPFVCTVCLKAFKRKEQLTLHFVIHSGEKRHVCPECGKGFYRKDHLRKHTRSHLARRVKAEMSQHAPTSASHPLATTPQTAAHAHQPPS